MNAQDKEAMVVIVILCLVVLVFLIVYFAVKAVVCLILSRLNDRIPVAHRKVVSSHIWLLLIPCFSLVWNFFIFPVMADSIREAQMARGDRSDDGSNALALSYCIVGCGTYVPWLQYLAAPIALILLIITLVMFNSSTDRLRSMPPNG